MGQATIVVVWFLMVVHHTSKCHIPSTNSTAWLLAWLLECQTNKIIGPLFDQKNTKPGCSRNIWDARFDGTIFRNCKTTKILAAMKGKLGVEGRQKVRQVCNMSTFCKSISIILETYSHHLHDHHPYNVIP